MQRKISVRLLRAYAGQLQCVSKFIFGHSGLIFSFGSFVSGLKLHLDVRKMFSMRS